LFASTWNRCTYTFPSFMMAGHFPATGRPFAPHGVEAPPVFLHPALALEHYLGEAGPRPPWAGPTTGPPSSYQQRRGCATRSRATPPKVRTKAITTRPRLITSGGSTQVPRPARPTITGTPSGRRRGANPAPRLGPGPAVPPGGSRQHGARPR